MLSIQALLSSPEPDDPLDTTVADHFKNNRKDADNVRANAPNTPKRHLRAEAARVRECASDSCSRQDILRLDLEWGSFRKCNE